MPRRNGDNVAIAGTIIGDLSQAPGPPKPDRRLLIFGKGPNLGLLKVQNFLVDPQIQVLDAGGQSNDQWRTIDDDSGDANGLEEKLMEAGRAPTCRSQADLPIDPCDKESALWPTFSPGLHTVKLCGANGATGIGLIEFYEY